VVGRKDTEKVDALTYSLGAHARSPSLPLQSRVPAVFYGIVSAAGEQLGDDCKETSDVSTCAIAHFAMHKAGHLPDHLLPLTSCACKKGVTSAPRLIYGLYQGWR
jgi:hypothetical protein